MSSQNKNIELTKYSHGGGCGCKIAPQVLQQMLKGNLSNAPDPALLVGNESNDDAAVYDLGNGSGLIATTDFFMPIVDSAFDFGRVAAANAISDVYAMGGRPILALALLGWPLEKLPAELASEVIDGARSICRECGISLAGGHTIDNREPLFGLAVNGLVDLKSLKKNNGARAGDLLFLTKPLGTGILSTARKRGVISEEHYAALVKQLTTLNSIGEKLGAVTAVSAMTDVTGFGLMGHLLEMALGSGLSAELFYDKVPRMAGIEEYLQKNTVPDSTFRNWNSYQAEVEFDEDVNVTEAFSLLPDPQTNGGLLFSVGAEGLEEVKDLLSSNGLQEYCEPVGRFTSRGQKALRVRK